VAAEEGGGLIRDADDEVETLAGVLAPDEIAESEPLVLGVRKVSTYSVWMSTWEPYSCVSRDRMIRSTSALA
jgi:hypothetical protein